MMDQQIAWLNEDEPKHPNSYPLSRTQRQTLMIMFDISEKHLPYVVFGKKQHAAMKRLAKRGLVICTNDHLLLTNVGISSIYTLTSAGQHTIYGFSEYK